MGRRLTTGLDAYHPISDKRYEREPFVPDGIKLSGSRINQILEVAEDVGADGPRIVELLGASRDGGLVDVDHTLTVEQQPELVELLDDLMERIDAEIQTDWNLEELAYETRSSWEEILDSEDHLGYRIYLKARSIRKLVEFAHEHDLDLYIG